jgi:hypothetical protein
MITFYKKNKKWVASRNGIEAEGNTKQKAQKELEETEMFIRIAKRK